MVDANRDITLRSAHVEAASTGPNEPRAGPVFPKREIETESTSVICRFGSRKEMVSIEAVTKTIHELTIPKISQTFSSLTTSLLNLIATTFLGRMILMTSLFANSKAIRIRRTFRPPPVDPALAPTIINSSNTN